MGNTIAACPRSYGEGDPYEVEFQSEIKKKKRVKTDKIYKILHSGMSSQFKKKIKTALCQESMLMVSGFRDWWWWLFFLGKLINHSKQSASVVDVLINNLVLLSRLE